MDHIDPLAVLSDPDEPGADSCLWLRRPTPKMEWKKKDSSLMETSGQLESHNRWLHFSSIALEDDGEYECQAFNSLGSAAHSFTVTVEGTEPGPSGARMCRPQYFILNDV